MNRALSVNYHLAGLLGLDQADGPPRLDSSGGITKNGRKGLAGVFFCRAAIDGHVLRLRGDIKRGFGNGGTRLGFGRGCPPLGVILGAPSRRASGRFLLAPFAAVQRSTLLSANLGQRRRFAFDFCGGITAIGGKGSLSRFAAMRRSADGHCGRMVPKRVDLAMGAV